MGLEDPLAQAPRGRRPIARPLDHAMDRFGEEPTSARRAMFVIIVAIVSTVVIGGVAMWIVDRREYPDLGVALWFALQTVTTIGYGDVTPREPLGRVVGSVIMVLAVAFLAIVTASITSTFFESRQRARRERARIDEAEQREHLEAQAEQMLANFEQMLAKLDAIERRLAER